MHADYAMQEVEVFAGDMDDVIGIVCLDYDVGAVFRENLANHYSVLFCPQDAIIFHRRWWVVGR